MNFKGFISLTAALLLVLPMGGTVAAQTSLEQAAIDKEAEKKALAAAEKAARDARENAEARIDADMVLMSDVAEALSKNLGQLHFLRKLCFGDKNQFWRDFAGRMISVEAERDLDRREALTRAFNAGYFQEQERFTSCSKNVSADAAAIAENGRRLATMLGDPYRNN